MKKITILLVISVLYSSAHSQTYKTIDFIMGYEIRNDYIDNGGFLMLHQGNRTGHRLGGNFNIRVMDRLIFKTGIRYVRIGNNFNSNLFSIPILTVDGMVTYSNQHFDEYYLELPIMFRYEFNQNDFTFFGEIGVSPHYAVKGKIIRETNLGKTSNDYDIQEYLGGRINMAYVLGFGVNYNIKNSHQVFVFPAYRYYKSNSDFSPGSSNNTDGIRNFGIEIGLRKVLSTITNESY